jgi:Na+/proline symporter
MFFWIFGFYTSWMLGIACLAYQKLKGFDDYATHFVGRKDYGVFVMMLTMFATFISGHTITNGPNTSSALGYTSFFILPLYCYISFGWSWVAPRMRRISVVRQWNSYSDVFADRCRNPVLVLVTIIFPASSLEGYIIAQLWALRALIPVVSDGMMHDDRVCLLLTCVIFICESFGGFDAVSYTDVIQGVIMIIAITIGPSYMSYHFGGLSGSVEFNCPGTWFEVLPDPDSNGTITKRRGCYAYKSPWNVLHPAGAEYGYFFKPLWPTYGVDGSIYFNKVGLLMSNVWSYIVAFNCYPHVTCRLFASKSDFHCRKSIAGMSYLSLSAGLPGLILGFFFAIHIERMYPAGTVTFGGILDFMMRQGGLPEFFACMAACGGLAGIMSTADSSALAITNMFTKEVVVNGIFRIAPQMDTHRFMTLMERGCTGFSLTLSLFFTIIFMPARVEADPMEAKLIMNRIGFYQMGLVAQSLPATMLIMYSPTAKPVPMILADISSLIILPALSLGFFEKKYYGSNVPEAPTDLWLHPVVISTLINMTVMLITNAVLPDGIAYAFNFKGEKEPLTYDMILEIMKGTVETCHSPVGRGLYAALLLFSLPAIPWYGRAYNGCDIETYAAHNDWIIDSSLPKPPDCEPEGISPCGSFTANGGVMIGTFVIDFPITSMMFWAWKPDPVAGLGNEAAQADGEKA